MTFPFDSRQGLVITWAELSGPSGRVRLRLALDTGATSTRINTGHLVALGYDPSLAPNRVQVTTGSGVEYVPRIPLTRVRALGMERADFPVLSHTLPPSATIDGLLGLDFLRDRKLTIDFRLSQISFE